MKYLKFSTINYKTLLFTLVITVNTSIAQTPAFQWVKTFGSVQQDYINDMAIDKNGFIYVLGTFSDTLNANPNDSLFPIANNVLQFNADSNQIVNMGYGYAQLFFAKFNAQGNAIWVKNLGSTSTEFAQSIVIDHTGNIIISGNGYNNISLNPNDTVSLLNLPTNFVGFLGKFDINGNLLWKTHYSYIDLPLAPGEAPYTQGIYFPEIVCTSDNQLMIAGFMSGNFVVAHNEVVIDTIFAGSYKGMLMKLNENGFPVFENFFSTFGPNAFGPDITSIAINSNDEVVITGSFTDTIEFVSGNPSSTLIQPDYAFGQRMFFTKFSSAGTFIWAKTIEGYTYTHGNDIVFDAYNNMYITGFVGPQPNFIFTLPLTDFDPDTATYEIPRYTFNTSEKSAFLASYTNNGAIRWAHWFYGANYDTFLGGEVDGEELVIDGAGRIYMAGTTRCKILDVNPGVPVVPLTPGTNALNSPPNPYILRFTTDGNYLAQRIFYAETGWAQINEMVTDSAGQLFSAGYFTNNYQFNYTNAATNTSLNSDSSSWWIPAAQDMFLTKHNTCINRTYINHQLCAGDSILFNGYWLKKSGTYPKFISTSSNCENIEILKLTVLPNYEVNQTHQLCNGDSITINTITYTQTGNYSQLLVSSLGCDSIINITLFIDTLQAQISNAGQTLSAINFPTNVTFQWLDCDDNFNAILNQTDSVFYVINDGNYALLVAQNGCVDTSDCYNVSTVNSIELTNSFIKVFPNPADKKLIIQMKEMSGKVYLYSSIGKLIFENEITNNNVEINTTDFANGVYLLQSNNEQIKVIIQH